MITETGEALSAAIDSFFSAIPKSEGYYGTREDVPIPHPAELELVAAIKKHFPQRREDLTPIADRLDPGKTNLLAAFALRMATYAARVNEAQYLRAGVVGLVVDENVLDWRDVLMGLSVIEDCAKRLGIGMESAMAEVKKLASPRRRETIDGYESRTPEMRGLKTMKFEAQGGGATLSYRSAGSASDPGRVMQERLRMREQGMLAKIVALLAVGVPATFAGPGAVSCVAAIISFRFGFSVAVLDIFLVATVIVVPLLFWLEWRSRGQFYEQGIMGIAASGISVWTEMNTWNALSGFYGDPEFAGLGWMEICLWGPRQILEAVRKIRIVRSLEGVKRERVEIVLLRLLSEEHAIEIDSLWEGSEAQMGEVLAALAYLLVYDWIGTSKDGKRVWVTSEAREKLTGRGR